MTHLEIITRTVRQEPDESLLDALGNQHSLETALADIIDNAIEYGGTEVVVQLITEDEELTVLRVVDNGRGMSPSILEEAMQLRKKRYSETSLSYFGMGMKMASLSQAAQLRVFTKSELAQTSGAQIRRADAGGVFNVEFLSDEFAADEFQSYRRQQPGSGTVIEWKKIDSLPISRSSKEKKRFLEETVRKINSHLGLIFHRFISENTAKIFVEIWDKSSQQVGTRTPAKPIDPFDFRSPIPAYPNSFSSRTQDKTRVEVYCAVVPPGSDSENVKIGSASLEQLSGFYVYRNRRLIQVGGWQNVSQKPSRDLQLGRVRIELTDELINAGLKLTAEKTKVKFSPEIQKAVFASKSIQLNKTFEDYLSDLEKLKKASNKRNTGLQPTTRLVGDENAVLKKAIDELIGFKPGPEQITIVSEPLRPDQVFEIDIEEATLRINLNLFAENGPLDSETGYEFFKATLYFLLEGHFSKTQLNKSTYAKIEQMHRVLAVALGIQTLDSKDFVSPIIVTPAIMAGLSKTDLAVKPVPTPEEHLEISFKSVWSSKEEKTNSTSYKELLETWRAEPASEPLESEKKSPKTANQLVLDTPEAFASDRDLALLGLEIWKSYKKSHDVTSVAEELSRTSNEIVAVLAQLVLRFEGVLNNLDEAWQADEPFTSSERDRLIAKFKDGHGLDRLSLETGRTCLHIAKEILDSPNFTAKVSPTLLKKLGEATN